MKLYFSPGACSLSPHIVLREAGAKFDLEQVDLREKKTKKGDDYWKINPKGQVPLLELDDGQRISEGPAIVQYIADKNPAAGLVPAAGSIDRYHLQGWLTHIGTELHKTFGPCFRPTTPDEYKKLSKETAGEQVPRHRQGAGRQAIPDGRQVLGRRRLSLHGDALGAAHRVRPLAVSQRPGVHGAGRGPAEGAGGAEGRGVVLI